jgi:DNA invertase Pin-like site-specific DNA recombinase
MTSPSPTVLRTETLDHLLTTPCTPRVPLVVPWLREAESVLIYAPTGVGKSMLTLTLALSIAGGGSFLGWSVSVPRRVLLVDGEMHREDLADRCHSLLPTIEGCDREMAGQNMTILSRQYQHPDADFPDLAKSDGQDQMLARIRDGRFDVVVIDNLSTLAQCDDENSASAIRPLLSFLLRLKQAGVACILVHHSNKSGKGYRGSTMLSTTFEVILSMQRSEGWTPDQGAAFELQWDKYRGKPDSRVVPMHVILEQVDGDTRWQHNATQSPVLRQLVERVRSMDYSTQREVADAVGISPGEVSKRKREAIKASLITEREWDECLKVAREAADG